MKNSYELIINGFELQVEAEVIKGEPEETDYPGTPDVVKLFSASINGWSILLELSSEEEEEIERSILGG